MSEDELQEAGRQAALSMLTMAVELFGAEHMASFVEGVLEASAAGLALYGSADAAGDFCIGIGYAVRRVGHERRAAMN